MKSVVAFNSVLKNTPRSRSLHSAKVSKQVARPNVILPSNIKTNVVAQKPKNVEVI